jgi:hypothetical protein
LGGNFERALSETWTRETGPDTQSPLPQQQ